MKQILSLIVFVQFLCANPNFSNEEKSVFGQQQAVTEEVQNKEILTFEDESNNNLSSESTIKTKSSSDDLLRFAAERFEVNKQNHNNLNNEPLETTNTESSAIPTTNNESVEFTENEILVDKNNESINSSLEENTSNDINIEEDEQNIEDVTEPIVEQIDYFTKVYFDNSDRKKSIYLSYLDFPKKIYKNQRFEIVIKALITTDDEYTLETRFINATNMTVLNPENEWIAQDSNSFENQYYFKASDERFKIPTFQILIYKNAQLVETAYIEPKKLVFTQIAQDDEKFSSIIAKSLKVNAYKTKQYNNHELITILDIEAHESNLEDFHLRYVEEQGFSKITDSYPNQQMLYYLVMPVHKKKIEFNYYNTQDKKFQKISIPIVLDNELISTQTDLNPNNSNLLLYKKIALSILSVVFLIMYIWKRKYTYLILLLVSLIFLMIFLIPNKQAFVKSDTTIYILPTKNSTIFYKTKKVNIVQVAMKKENFVKIIMNLNNKKIIGWIKEDKLVKN